MPPVKRTRSTRTSTHATKTARAPSHPTAPQEQITNPVNVNLEALMATLSTSVGSPQTGDIVAQVPGVP